MSSPRFEPRLYLEPGTQWDFGRVDPNRLRWGSSGGDDPGPARLRAAQQQAALAFEMRRHLEGKPEMFKRVAKTAGCSPERLTRVLRGEVIMRLEDLAAFSLSVRVPLALEIGDERLDLA